MSKLHPQTAAPVRPEAAVSPGRGPIAPRFAFPLIDTLLRARPTTVLGVQAETPTIFVVRLDRPSGFHHRAGQHAVLRLGTDQGPDLRPLSIASAPWASEVQFATRIGPSAYKRAFVALEPGDQVKVSRPMGGLRLDPSRPAVMVSGGIGITPLRSMLADAVSSGYKAPIRLLFSNHGTDEIPFRGELDELAGAHPDLRITWVLSTSAAGAPDGDVVVGRVDTSRLRQHANELPGALFYVTGPAAMVHDVTSMLRGIGLPKSQIRAAKQTLPGPRGAGGKQRGDHLVAAQVSGANVPDGS